MVECGCFCRHVPRQSGEARLPSGSVRVGACGSVSSLRLGPERAPSICAILFLLTSSRARPQVDITCYVQAVGWGAGGGPSRGRRGPGTINGPLSASEICKTRDRREVRGGARWRAACLAFGTVP